MAQMAIPAQSAFASGVAELPTVLALLSTLAATRCSQHLSVRSETLDQRAGCGKSARPDPWEPSMSNHRGPPDRQADANTAPSLRKRIAVRGTSRARRVQTVNCWRADVFANRPDSTSSAHFGIESLAENAEIA